MKSVFRVWNYNEPEFQTTYKYAKKEFNDLKKKQDFIYITFNENKKNTKNTQTYIHFIYHSPNAQNVYIVLLVFPSAKMTSISN